MATTAPVVLADRFELGEWLGRGTLSVVHAAVDRATGRRVAVKLAVVADHDPEQLRLRFEREAAALSVIASEHLVELIAAGATPDGRPFLVLERLEGRDLQEIVADLGPLPPEQVARIISQAATALELAHGLGIVHRDLKPANLFLHTAPEQRGVVKVLDFGMVVDVGGPVDRDKDAFGGTPLYMAPEQVRGQLSRIGPATDIWALAFVTLTLLTGEVYWEAATTHDILRAIEASSLAAPSTRWPWLPPAFDAWFARSTRRVPERRFRSVAEQAAQLTRALRGVVAPDRTPSPTATAAGVAETMAARTPTVVRVARGRPVIGRDLERSEIEVLLAPGEIVTLTGTAGVGKTRLAEAVCESAGERHVDGAWFVPLGAGHGAEPVLAAIAHALALPPDTTRPLFDHVVSSVVERRLLLALDGAEQVDGAAEVIQRLRRACPQATWLVTARLPLGLEHERCIGVEPLDVPRAGPVTAGEAATFAAVELFVRRARDAVPLFNLDDDTVDDVVAICRAVEGFPLGLELAAARLQASGLPEIRAALEDRRRADGTIDQRSSIRHAVAWSYGLLAAGDQALLRHLAPLPAGLTFEQVQDRLGHLGDDTVGAVLRLVRSHLVSWTADEPRRLVMLDTVRELCRDLSRAAGEDVALWRMARAHAEQVAAWDGAAIDQERWLALVDAEHDNLRTVLAHLLGAAPAAAMHLAGQLAWYWYVRGHYAEGARWLDEAIARSGATTGEDLTRALHGAGRLALLTCNYVRAEALLDQACHLAHDGGDVRGEAAAVQLLGSVARERGAYQHARALHQRSLALWEQLGDAREAARARNYLVFAAWIGDPAGDPGDDARGWWAGPAEDELRRLGDPEGIVWALLNRGAILHYRGDHAGAREVIGRAFAGSISARFHEGIAWSLELLGLASLARGEHLQARAQLAASLRVHRRLGDRWRCASVLEALAAVAVATDRPARGAVYLGGADAVRGQIGAPVPACEQALFARTERRGDELLGDAFARGRERGRRTPLDHIVELAREIA